VRQTDRRIAAVRLIHYIERVAKKTIEAGCGARRRAILLYKASTLWEAAVLARRKV